MTVNDVLWLILFVAVGAMGMTCLMLAVLAMLDAGYRADAARKEAKRRAEWIEQHTRYNAEIVAYLANMDGVT